MSHRFRLAETLQEGPNVCLLLSSDHRGLYLRALATVEVAAVGATEDRDQAIAEALGKLAVGADIVPMAVPSESASRT